jgi:6-phosphogluconolactonase
MTSGNPNSMHQASSDPAAGERREVIVVEDDRALAQAAARRLVARVTAAKDRAAVCLTGGSSPEGLYRLLSEDPWRGEVPWDRVHWFMGDDRFVAQDDPLSNMGVARRLFLDRVGAPRGNVHPIPTDTNYPEGAARLYAEELHRFYGADRLDPARPLFDLVLMGLGGDGHTASLFPHAAALEERERWVVGVAKAGMEPFVPRVTLTFPALAATREMLFLVNGASKRDVLRRVLSGADLPAAHAHANGALVWLVDRAAAPEDQHAQ